MSSKEFIGKDLANLLGVRPTSLSAAARKDFLCQGYSVADWAERDPRGKVLKYHVPDEAYRELRGLSDESNKSDEQHPKGNIESHETETIKGSNQAIRDRIFNSWSDAISDLTPDEIDEKEKEVRKKFSGIALEEFERATEFHVLMSEVEDMLSEAQKDSKT